MMVFMPERIVVTVGGRFDKFMGFLLSILAKAPTKHHTNFNKSPNIHKNIKVLIFIYFLLKFLFDLVNFKRKQ